MRSSAIDCDIVSTTKTKRVRHGDEVQRSSFLSSFMDSLCHVRNKLMYVLLWQTVSVLIRLLFWCLFPSLLCNSGNIHQNNPLVSTETIRHSSTNIILYILRHGPDFRFGKYSCILLPYDKLMALHKTAVSPLLMHWRYCSLALSNWHLAHHQSLV